jgi:hypothetical protein
MEGKAAQQGTAPDPVLGLLMIVIGGVLLSDKLNVLKLMELMEYWPVFLVGGGIAVLLEQYDRRCGGL